MSPQTVVMASTDNDQEDDEEREEDSRGDDDDDENEGDEEDSNEIDLDELNLLQICCAWSDKISDGVLEYRISDEGDEKSRQFVRSAIQDWDLLIANLVLVERSDGDDDDADIEIGFSDNDEDADGEEYDYGGSVAAGVTRLGFDSKGFIDSVEVTLSGGIFDNQFQDTALEQIAKHEIGHALGLGHANFDESLMFVSTNSGTRDISNCEISGVFAANHWILAGGSGSGDNDGPEYPDAHFVVC